jgi:filamentous hemagglutinin family protein
MLLGANLNAEAVFDGSVGPTGTLSGAMVVEEQHGTRVDTNLFHSFSILNVNPGESLTFTSDFAGITDNVISRVTGSFASLIDGPIFSEIPGAALWLINPNGLVFGEGALVDVQGSFHASTADYLLLGDGGRFGTDLANAANTTLTMANPVTFGFLDNNIAPIDIQGSPMFVPYGESIEFVGGDINISGAFMVAEGGGFGMTAVDGPGEVSRVGGGYAGADRWGDITLLDSEFIANGDGGAPVSIRSGQLVMQGSLIEARTFGDIDAAGINIDVHDFLMTDFSRIDGITFADGQGSDITISATGSVRVDSGGVMDVRVGGAGDAGDITITAGDSITFDGEGTPSGATRATGTTFGPGRGSDMTLTAPVVGVLNGAILYDNSFGPGDGGTISLIGRDSVSLAGTDADGFSGGIYAQSNNTGHSASVSVVAGDYSQLDAAYILLTSFGEGDAGSVTIDATGDVNFAGVGVVGDPNTIDLVSVGTGSAGTFSVSAANMLVTDGTRILTVGEGDTDGGDITLQVDGQLEIGGFVVDDFGSHYASVLTAASENGVGGTITIDAGDVLLSTGGELFSNAFGAGSGGDITITTGSFTSSGGYTNFVDEFGEPIHAGANINTEVTEDLGGSGGNITINADNIEVGRGSELVTRSQAGAAGNITLVAGDTIQVGWTIGPDDDPFEPGTFLSAQSFFRNATTGQGGSINLTASNIDILGSTVLETQSFLGEGSAGDINIHATDLLNVTASGFFSTEINSEAAFGATPGNINMTGNDIILDGLFMLSDVSFSDAFAGDVTITADSSLVLDNSTIITSWNYFGRGGGDIRVSAPDIVMRNFARLSSDTFGETGGDAGDIYVDGSNFLMESGATIDVDACPCSNGSAGNVYINVDTLDILGTGFINVQTGIRSTALGSGDAGDIIINAREITLSDVAVITAYSPATQAELALIGFPDTIPGDAGNIVVTADSLIMDESFIETTATEAAGGNLMLDIASFLYATDSFIGAQAGGLASDDSGGNVSIFAGDFIILDASDISASANAGNGGNIDITTDAIIVAPYSSIDASSQQGVDGEVVVESPNRLVASVTPLDPPALDVTEFNEDPCEIAVDEERSSFTVPSSDGVSEAPGDYQSSPLGSLISAADNRDHEGVQACVLAAQ